MTPCGSCTREPGSRHVDADLALRWMSETGTGRVRDLRERLAWLAHTEDFPILSTATGRWLRDVSALGHAEIDWQHDRWAVAPPVITPLPCSDGTAVLAGSRRTGLMERLQATNVSVLTCRPDAAPGDLPVPTAVLIQYDSADGLQASAADAGVRFSGCAARKLAERLPPLRAGQEAPPPARGNATLERLDTGTSFLPADADRDGLYRLRLQGRSAYLQRQGGVWRHCDLATGVFAEYARRGGISVMRWRAERDASGGPVGTVFVDWGAPLPALHARTLTLCSGLPPRFSSAARTTTYTNIPADVALAVARSLLQRLQPI
jgi:hypothetical protein